MLNNYQELIYKKYNKLTNKPDKSKFHLFQFV